MSKAVRCDRCGMCFDPMALEYKDGHFYICFKNPKKLSYVKDEKIIEGIELISNWNCHLCFDNKHPDDTIDLCEKCSKEFLEFMEHKERTDAQTQF